jgi:protease IV
MEHNLPPSSPTPPVIASQSRRRRRGYGWLIFALAVVGVLALFSLYSLIGSATSLTGAGRTGRQTGRVLQEVTVENNGSRHKMAIIDVEGMITSLGFGRAGDMVGLIEDQLKMAARDQTVRAVVLKVNSPGGEVLASDDISRALHNFQVAHGKPVVAVMGGLAASGGYYVSAPCQWIVANELTLTGSIGVILNSFNYRGLLDKVGIYPQVFKSGRFKDMLSGAKKPEEIEPEERQMIQDLIDQTHAKFVQVVQDGRAWSQKANEGQGRTLVSEWKDYADGRVLTGRQAFDLGFVDELGNFETAVARARKMAELPNANLIRYEEPFRLGSLFSLFGESRTQVLKVDLGIEMPRLEPGRLYFLSPTVLH